VTPVKSIARRALQVFAGRDGDRSVDCVAAVDDTPPLDRGQKLLFVRGHQRSGTNWTCALLNLHPKICCMGEFHLEQIAVPAHRLQTVCNWQFSTREPVRSAISKGIHDLVRGCIVAGCAPRNPGAEWLGDRTPRRLMDMVPDGRYFWIVRDGRDVLVSFSFHHLNAGPSAIERCFPQDIAEWLIKKSEAFRKDPTMFGRFPELLLSNKTWVRYVATEWGRWYWDDRRAADKLNSTGPEPVVMDLSYEKLHEDPDGERVRMYRFLGLDPSQARPLSEESRTTAGYTKNDPTQFHRKGRVGDWQHYFTDEVRDWFKQAAGEALVRAGYAEDNDW